MRKKIIGILILCLILVGAVACEGLGGGGETAPQESQVVRGDLEVIVSGSGAIELSEEADLFFNSMGKIERIYVAERDSVTKGEAIAKLDTSALELALNQALVAYDEAEYNLKQLRDVLHASGDRLELAEAQLELAGQAIAQARKNLDEATIKAPFAGVIATVYVDEGDNASVATPVVHLIDLNSMELIAEVDEIDIADVEVGQAAVIEVDALPNLRLKGTVKSISLLPKTLAGVLVYEVTIELDIPPNSGLKVGMSATADIKIDERIGALLIPNRMVQEDSQGNTFVIVKAGEETQERPVVTGISDGLRTEIVSGLSEGETVVAGPR